MAEEEGYLKKRGENVSISLIMTRRGKTGRGQCKKASKNKSHLGGVNECEPFGWGRGRTTSCHRPLGMRNHRQALGVGPRGLGQEGDESSPLCHFLASLGVGQ